MYQFIRPLLFKLDPEVAHSLSLNALRLAGALPPVLAALRWIFDAPPRKVRAFNVDFANPVGLAAGYDKDAGALGGLAALGFGHLEVGTVTLRPQEGNPRPRIFRLPEDNAIINRMGFPGRGAGYALGQILNHRAQLRGCRLGINLGKNKHTPLHETPQEYAALLRVFAPVADYLAVNISSPNTAGLRDLQGRALLEDLLNELARTRQSITPRVPILVKLAPDLTAPQLDDALAAITTAGMDGVIVTNTTLARPNTLRSRFAVESGGLSGAPLRPLSEQMLIETVRRLDGKLPIVSVGGIASPEDARRRLDLGATLIQVYTGLIYAGPALVQSICRAL